MRLLCETRHLQINLPQLGDAFLDTPFSIQNSKNAQRECIRMDKMQDAEGESKTVVLIPKATKQIAHSGTPPFTLYYCRNTEKLF